MFAKAKHGKTFEAFTIAFAAPSFVFTVAATDEAFTIAFAAPSFVFTVEDYGEEAGDIGL